MSGPAPLVFVGIGVGAYDDASFERLPQAFSGVAGIGRILQGYGATVHLAAADPTEEEAVEHLTTHLPPDGFENRTALIVLWAGHALLAAEPALRLIGKNSRREAWPSLKAADLASIAARCGARQILIVLDTCYSGDAALDALRAAVNVQAQVTAHAGADTFVGVLAATLPLQRARDGLFGEHLARILAAESGSPLTQRLWSPHESHVSLEAIADTLMREWDDGDQHPRFGRDGVALGVVPNPWFDASAPEAIVEHLLLAARGAEPGEEASYFTGRVEPIEHVVSWLDGGRPGVFVVTGPAGSGKSAIVGRIVSLSDPTERERILATGPLEHADPAAGSVHAHVHARGLTMERLVEEIDRRLVTAGVLAPGEGGTRNRGELLGAVERAEIVPVIAIDGLDEAGSEARKIAEDAVRLLRTHARFLVSTRKTADPSLLEALQPDEQVDLGDDRFADQTTGDVVGYAIKRLEAVAPDRMNAKAVGELLAHSGEGAFLLARIVTAQLRETPIDTTVRGWEDQLATAVETALEHDLENIDPLRRDGRELPDAGRELLTALAWGYGVGMPQEIWAIAATGLSPTHTVYTSEDVLWLLENAGRYIVEAGEAGRAVYRLAHQRLTDHFLPSRRIDHVEAQAARLAQVLCAHYLRLLDAGSQPQEPAYLWRYAWRHAADGGVTGVDALRPLAARARNAFASDLAMALNHLAIGYSEVGRRAEAVAPAEEAAELYRARAAESPGLLPALAMALSNLGIRYSEVGRRAEAVAPTEEAVELRRAQAAENPGYLADLAGALNNLGVRYSEVGRRAEAVAPTEEATELYRAQAAENPGYLPALASVLNNLGIRYNAVGRRAEAVAPTEEAAELYRAQAAENPGYLPALASVLNNLGVFYSEVGRRAEAVAPTEEAVLLRRAQAAENPGHLPELAGALSNLGARYSAVGRRAEAVAPTEEAVELYRAQAAQNPGYLPDLAMALNNLGVFYSEVGRRAEAIAPTEEAVLLRRAQAAENSGYLPELAGALSNLGARYSEVGRRAEAIAPAEEAVGIYRAQAAQNAGYLPDLAMALSNLGIFYSAVGRRAEAVAPAEEAVELRRAQAAENPGYLPALAMALNNLGIRYSAVGRHAEAVAPTEEAVELRRAQAAENPGYLPALAGALNNLGIRYNAVGRRAEAVAPTEEAADIYRAQAAQNPGYLPDLAMALNNLGIRYSAVGRHAEAVAPTEEAVELRRAQAAENPGYLPDLAGGLSNLGTRYGEVGRRTEAIAPAEEAVDIYRAQATQNPAYLPDLAMALNNLGIRYDEVGRHAEIDAAWDRTLSHFASEDAKQLFARLRSR